VEPGPASLNDKEMLKLWDRILDTFRLRPADKSSNASSDTGPSSSSPSSARPLPLWALSVWSKPRLAGLRKCFSVRS